MIDQTDTQTQQIPFEAKRGRGRPKTGKAMTPAEKQRAYRERNKGNVTDNSAEIKALQAEIEELKIALGKEVIARKTAEAKLISVTDVSSKKGREKTEPGWHVQGRARGTVRWKNLSKMASETEKEATASMFKLIDSDITRLVDYRVREVKSLA
ncbi:hypothetical protein ABEH28_14700 [Pseudomonas sp. Ps21-P2]|uniref:hypothetical protein n=1 Tax=Pseudomonas sp. Ps21-P2 TaxID=3080331 RepID=UPI0032099D09